MSKRVTLNNINKAVRALGYRNVELVRGNGYYYWSGGVASGFRESGIYAMHLSSQPIEWYVKDFKQRLEDSK